MPINIPNDLPAKSILEQELVFLITKERAEHQDIRPLKVIILNLMPKKIETETQLLRLLANTPLQVDVELLQTATHVSKNTHADHLLNFYKTFDQIKERFYDAMIITGAPVEQLPFEEVDYWPELVEILDWSKSHVFSTLHICWGAQAGLFHHYGVQKVALDKKMFGIFPHHLRTPNHMLVRGFDEEFLVPHSRHTAIDEEAVYAHPALTVLAASPISGVHFVTNHNIRHLFACGHCEYDRRTLANEYFRDVANGLPIDLPYGYFPENNPDNPPKFLWRSHANLFFKNWLGAVYQHTPYRLSDIATLPSFC